MALRSRMQSRQGDIKVQWQLETGAGQKCPVRVCLGERKEIQKDPGNSNKPEDKKDIGKVCLERQMKIRRNQWLLK